MYLLTNERYITYQAVFSFGRLGHAQGSDLGVPWGVVGQDFYFPEIQPDLVCEILTGMAHAPAQFFWPRPLGPWGGANRSNIIKFQLQSQFQRFFNQTLCVFSHMKDIKHFRRDFHLVAWVMSQVSDLGVTLGVWGVKKKFFSNSTRFGV